MTVKKSNSKKQIIQLAASFALGILLTIATCYFTNKGKMVINLNEKKEYSGKVAARINGQDIYLSEIDEKLAEINPNLKFENLKPADKELIVKEIFVQKIIYKNTLKSRKAYKEHSDILRNFAIEEAKANYLREAAKKEIKEDQIKAKYQELLDSVKGKKEYLVSHILVKDKASADKVAAALKTGSFEDVAKKFSIDSKSAVNGGDLGYILEGSTIKEFEDQIKSLKKDAVSKPFKSPLGWHIAKVRDVRDVAPAKYEDVKEKIENSLLEQGKRAYVLSLVDKAKIEIL